jgi:hypothetical protein
MARRKLGLVPMDAMTIRRLQSFLLVLLVIWAAVPLALAAPKGLKRAAAAASADDVLPIMAVGTGCAALVMCPSSRSYPGRTKKQQTQRCEQQHEQTRAPELAPRK